MKKILWIVIIVTMIYGLPALCKGNEQDSLPQNAMPHSEMTKSGTGALLRSFAVPGWGQLYVESYWKAPIFFGGAATLFYFIISNNSDFNKYNREYSLLTDKTSFDALTLRNKKEYYRDNRDLSAFYLLGVYALAAVDAFVGAHLYDFNVDDDLMLYISNKHDGIAINFRYKLK